MTRVCALVPHYQCEAWLGEALESLLLQTRPLDGIVVIDDASPQPPEDIVREFPGVTLLAAERNCGPYRLIQSVMEMTSFDAYLFQDADDWSAPDRLEVLLATAEQHGAELVGSHELRVLLTEGDVVAVRYPLDVNLALQQKPSAFPLMHPTSMVARTLVERLGGYATGMRFSGDAEFLRRAGHAARVVNADHFGYYRRKRTGSLTMAPETGLSSPARLAVRAELVERANANAQAVAGGKPPELAPWRTAPPVALRRVAGPEPGRRDVRLGWSPAIGTAAEGAANPVFVVGPPRSGAVLLGWAVGQHPAYAALVDSRWLARAAADVVWRADDATAPTPLGFRERLAAALGELVAADSRACVAAGTEVSDAAWALLQLFPSCRFVFVTRSVEATVGHLKAAPTEGGEYFTAEMAVRRWLDAMRTGLDLEAALGSERVHRVEHDTLMNDPTTTLKGVLGFLGVDYISRCVRPFSGMAAEVAPALSEPFTAAVAEQITDVAFRLATPLPASPDPSAAERLAKRFAQRWDPVVADHRSMVDKVRGVVARVAADASVVAVVSKGDARLLQLGTAIGWHYPQVEGGEYAGHHPADGPEAVRHLEQLRARGADYLVIPAASFWWLDFYRDLQRHLDEHHRLVAYQEDACLVYRLDGIERAAAAPPRVVVQARDREVAP